MAIRLSSANPFFSQTQTFKKTVKPANNSLLFGAQDVREAEADKMASLLRQQLELPYGREAEISKLIWQIRERIRFFYKTIYPDFAVNSQRVEELISLVMGPDVDSIDMNRPEYLDALRERTGEVNLAAEKFVEQAYTDPLTGAPNRMALVQQLEANWKEAYDGYEFNGTVPISKLPTMGLIFLDLDRFKPINDGFSHNVGDDALKHFVKMLDEACKDTDGHEGARAYRLAGDEFVILVDSPHNLEAVTRISEKFKELLTEHPMTIPEEHMQDKFPSNHIHLSSSQGAVFLNLNNFTGAQLYSFYPQRLLDLGDREMYNAKAASKRLGDYEEDPDQINLFDDETLRGLTLSRRGHISSRDINLANLQNRTPNGQTPQ